MNTRFFAIFVMLVINLTVYLLFFIAVTRSLTTGHVCSLSDDSCDNIDIKER